MANGASRERMVELNAISTRLRRERASIRLDAKVRSKAESWAIVADALESRFEVLGPVPLWELLGWCYWMDEVERLRIFNAAGVRDQGRLVRQLTERQRERVCESLRSVRPARKRREHRKAA